VELRSQRARRNNGFDDGLSQALSLVVGPLAFAFLGFLVDRALGTAPLFAVGLGILGFLCAAAALYYRYQAAVARDDEGKPWNRRQW
jgi:F0F1-type ATP synthase assembly protein I